MSKLIILLFSVLFLLFSISKGFVLNRPIRPTFATKSSTVISNSALCMAVKNDAFARANRETRKANAEDRVIEIPMPIGLELDEDKDGNVFVKSIDKGGRADKTGKVFVGDIVAMASATFGDDMWSCRGVGLSRVLTTIKMRNNKPVKLVLEAPNEMEEKKRRAIAFKEASEEEKKKEQEV